MKYVSFYTSGYYEDVYKNYLQTSANDIGLDVRAYKEHNYHDWDHNTRLKAHVIFRALNEWGDVVWLDADTTLKSYPKLFEEIPKEYDVAVYYLDWERHWRNKEGGKKRELVNSVMMLRDNFKVHGLMQQWIDRCSISSCWEQKVLQDLLEERSDIKQYHLPDSYCAIINHENVVPEYIKDPVIIQNQISREVKKNRMLLDK